MLAKKHRLTATEFERHFASGKRVHGTLLQLIHVPGGQFHGSAVAGKKVNKKAVRRNKLRRRIYGALYRAHRARDLAGVYIVIAKPAAATATFAELKEELDSLLARAG